MKEEYNGTVGCMKEPTPSTKTVRVPNYIISSCPYLDTWCEHRRVFPFRGWVLFGLLDDRELINIPALAFTELAGALFLNEHTQMR